MQWQWVWQWPWVVAVALAAAAQCETEAESSQVPRVAVVGSGIAGSAAAFFLRHRARLDNAVSSCLTPERGLRVDEVGRVTRRCGSHVDPWGRPPTAGTLIFWMRMATAARLAAGCDRSSSMVVASVPVWTPWSMAHRPWASLSGVHAEAGGAVIHKRNAYAAALASLFGLEHAPRKHPAPANFLSTRWPGIIP
jgi:glycine/D-amino acid oxidase-like deaminating enzyme